MAYFSNGSEGMSYEAHYCHRCVHREGCAVWSLHQQHNYEQCRDTPEGKAWEAALDALIPRSKDGLDNEQCTMFHEATHKTQKPVGVEG